MTEMMQKPMGFYYEDFNPGDTFVTVSRTVTEADVTIFAGLSGDYNQLHTDEEYAKTTVFGGRVAHGFLGLSIASGLTDRLKFLEGTAMAFLALNWKLVGAIRLGDTIHLKVTVESKRETKKPDRGIVTFYEQIINQHGDVVQEGQQNIMVKRKS